MVPASDRTSLAKCAWSAYPQCAATATSGTPRRARAERVAEAQDARQQLRAVAERVEGPALQLAGRQPDRRGDRSDPLAAAGAANDVGELRVNHDRAPGVAGHNVLQPRHRAGCGGDLLLEAAHLRRCPECVEAHPHVAHGVRRDAEDRRPEAGGEAQAGGPGARRLHGQEAAAIRPGDDEMVVDPQQVHAPVGQYAPGRPVRLRRPRDRPVDRRPPLPIHDPQPATPDLGCP